MSIDGEPVTTGYYLSSACHRLFKSSDVYIVIHKERSSITHFTQNVKLKSAWAMSGVGVIPGRLHFTSSPTRMFKTALRLRGPGQILLPKIRSIASLHIKMASTESPAQPSLRYADVSLPLSTHPLAPILYT